LQFLHLGVGGRRLELLGGRGDFIFQGDAPGGGIGGDGQIIVRGLLHGGDGLEGRRLPRDGLAVRRGERRADALEQTARVVEHGVAGVDGAFQRVERLAEFGFIQVADERLNGGEHDALRIAEQVFVVFELGELVGERLDLLHLIFNHGDVFGDVCRLINNLLNVHRRVVNNPLGTGRQTDADRDECECD